MASYPLKALYEVYPNFFKHISKQERLNASSSTIRIYSHLHNYKRDNDLLIWILDYKILGSIITFKAKDVFILYGSSDSPSVINP